MDHVLVVGGTGKLGLKIVRELAARGAKVRATMRDRSKSEAIEALQSHHAELVTADLDDDASLARACEGIEVVVSAVQGLRKTIVDGQARLMRAAERAGVARMIPSDYSVDFFRTVEGGNRNLDLRRELNRILDGSSVRGVSVLCGAFMDLLAYGAMGPDASGVFRVWGDEHQPYEFTHTDDVARFVAAVALDRSAPRVVRVMGDAKSPRELAGIFSESRGGAGITIQSAGSLDDLDRTIAKLRDADEAPLDTFPVWQQLQYVRDMASGKARLSPVDNARYPDIHPLTVRGLLLRA
jgi:uncharacterized protein YbjT (DUF2867 family)